ncbi:MAG: hypothetical protein IPH12_20375 [Saprospirales bacterium]|nr:hypothetical protein [Saprospirales bacterium]
MKTLLLLLCCLFLLPAAQSQGEFRLVELGDLRLANGQVIQNCKLGVRRFGRLTPEKNNVIVLLPWYSGSSEDFAKKTNANVFELSSTFGHMSFFASLGWWRCVYGSFWKNN